jgi:hypothetical protein
VIRHSPYVPGRDIADSSRRRATFCYRSWTLLLTTLIGHARDGELTLRRSGDQPRLGIAPHFLVVRPSPSLSQLTFTLAVGITFQGHGGAWVFPKLALAIDLEGRLMLNRCDALRARGRESSQREFPIGIAVHWKQTPGRPYRPAHTE